MVGAQARQVQVRDAYGPPPRRELAGFLQDEAVACATAGHASEEPIRCASARAATSSSRSLDIPADCVGEGFRIAERNEEPSARSEHVLRVPVGSRDDSAACGDRVRQRARGDLLPVAVRRHEDVGRGEQVGELVDREEPIVELDMAQVRARVRAVRASGGTARLPDARRPDGSARRSCRGSRGAARSSPAALRSPSPGSCQARSGRRWRAGRCRRRQTGWAPGLRGRLPHER